MFCSLSDTEKEHKIPDSGVKHVNLRQTIDRNVINVTRKAAERSRQMGDQRLSEIHSRMMHRFSRALSAGADSIETNSDDSCSRIEVPVLSNRTCQPPTDFVQQFNAIRTEKEKYQLIIQTLSNQSCEAFSLASRFADAGFQKIADGFNYFGRCSELNRSMVEDALSNGKSISYEFRLAKLPTLNMYPGVSDGRLEITVVRGISLSLPPKTNSWIRVYTQMELVLPSALSDEPQRYLTQWSRTKCCDPVFNFVTTFDLDTSSRSFLVFLKFNCVLQVNVYYRRGILGKSRLLGTASFQLDGLLQSIDLTLLGEILDEKKNFNGSLELRLRQRSVSSIPKLTAILKPWLILSSPASNSSHTLSNTSSKSLDKRSFVATEYRNSCHEDAISRRTTNYR